VKSDATDLITTERLDIVAATPDLVRAALDGPNALGAKFSAFVPSTWPPEYLDAAALQFTLDRLAEGAGQAGWWLHFVLLRNGEKGRTLIGTAGYMGPPIDDRTVEIGYGIVADFQRQGHGTEVVRGLLAHAFGIGAADRVRAETFPELAGSIGVLGKCGFSLIGEGSEPGVIRYQITRQEYRAHPSGKSTVEEIRQRFDMDVERFSNLETGQSATIDGPLALELIAVAASRTTPHASTLLDVGCGAGNYTLKLLALFPHLDVTLIDLSRPMLDRAVDRTRRNTSGKVTALQGDIRELEIERARFDIIVAGAVLHHLREEGEWKAVFSKLHAALKPGGSVWISDLVEHSDPQVQAVMWERYGAYLAQIKDATYRDQVFAYVAQEDSPRSLLFQIDLLRALGFREVEILHKNGCFATFGARKGA